MTTLTYIIISTLIISAGSIVGIITLSLNTKKLNKYLLFLVALSAGSMMGGAFFHLLPEAAEEFSNTNYLGIVLFSFITFYLIEKLLHWRHCHNGVCEIHSFGYMNLVGDAIHNFLDGLIIAAAFITDIRLGILTTIAIAMHEIPQEISDFGVLLHAGFSKKKALIANLLVALTVVIGGLVGYLISFTLHQIIMYL